MLEARLPSLGGRRAKSCCLVGARIGDISRYYLQYVGIRAGGRRLIYINAVAVDSAPEQWRTEPVTVCDGGRSYWGAMFDPATGEFSELAFNGES